MIVILAQYNDKSSQEVINWLKHFNINYVFLTENLNCDFSNFIIDETQRSLIINKQTILSLMDISSFWWRRGHLYNSILTIENQNSKKTLDTLNKYLIDEQKKSFDYLYFLLNKTKIKLGNFFKSEINKLIVLNTALCVGLKIPKTLVTSNKDELMSFFNKNNNLISKSIFDVLSYEDFNNYYINYTVTVTKEDVINLPEKFMLTLFQNYIEKKYELRIFIMKNKIYSMAILSQINSKESIDYRRYNDNKISVPYKLPKEIAKKVLLLCKKLNLDTGSIDMIVTPNLEYVFLEVNPDGQFGMVSYPCNYYIERDIASFLSNKK